MTDEKPSDDANKIEQQEDEDGEIEDEVDDEAQNATGMGARPKTTVTSAPAKTRAAKQSSRREPHVQQRRETRSTARSKQEAAGAEAAPPMTTDVDAPIIKINGQSQTPVDKNEQTVSEQ